MLILRYFLIILIIFSSFPVHAKNTSNNNNKDPEFISIFKTPCYIGCNYAFQYCYSYNISNLNNAIKVEEWEYKNGWVKGRAVVNINAKLLVKACYQLSLASAYAVVDEVLNLEAEFEFKVKLSKDSQGKRIKSQCINDLESSISYSSFELKGNLTDDPIPVMKENLIEDIKYSIRYSVYKAVYDSMMKGSSSENQTSKYIYCDNPEPGWEEDSAPCPCD